MGAPHLEWLDLSYNMIAQKEAIILAPMLKTHTNLRSINLSWNAIDDQGFGMIAQALLHNKSLQHLNIARNRITELSALLLKDMLVGTPNLTSVVLDGNP